MTVLEKPYEIYEWEDGKSEEWTILSWELGELTIQLRSREGTKDIEVLRIHVPPEEKPEFPHYHDLTSARLVKQLQGILPRGGLGSTKLRITAIGAAPRTHFSVTNLPERPV